MTLDDLPTPCLLVERSRLQRNLERMQARADAERVALRPHVKTHKSVALARRQQALGARGLTAAKPAEAEVFVEAGFDDVRLAYPVVGRDKHERLRRLMARARVSFCVDTLEGARAAAAVYAAHGLTADVLVEVDVGYGRTGLRWDHPDLVATVEQMAALPGLRLAGLLTHEGHSYRGPAPGEAPREALARVAREATTRLLGVAQRLHAATVPGVAPEAFTLSVGSTPSMAAFANAQRGGFAVTEIRPGNYVFNDAMQVALGSATLADCALTVLATVVSKHRDGAHERAFLDAGKKILTSDTGYGLTGHGVLLYNAQTMTPLPHARITALSEEHAWVEVPGGATLQVGDRVRIVPNHACVCVHTQDRLFEVDGEHFLGVLPVDARAGST